MSGKSAGQQAYEAFKAWRAERDPMMICTDWTHPAVAHEGWEAAGRAVETEQVRLARQDRNQLRDAVLDLAAKWDATAARNQRNGLSLIVQGDECGNEGLAVAETLGACVIDLRKIAEPPA